MLGSIMVVTVLGLASQAVGFVTQIVTAAFLGAGPEMDAFVAANTLPQYLLSVIANPISFVLIPVFIDYAERGEEKEAWRMARGLSVAALWILGAVSLIGIIFAADLVRWSVPGLATQTLINAAGVARVLWPTLLFMCVVAIQTSVCQANHRFLWQAIVPLAGALFNLFFVWLWARNGGAMGVGGAFLVACGVQMVLFLPAAFKGAKGTGPSWRHPGVREAFRLMWPLLASGLLVRMTPVVDRFLASSMPSGSISYLAYASRVLLALSILVSTGLPTVVFPRLASEFSKTKVEGLRHTLSLTLRALWLFVAPAVVVGGVMAKPIVGILFERGEFTPVDSASVASLLRIYLLALIGMAMGNITSRSLYVLKATRLVGVMGVVESVLYVGYAWVLSRFFGIAGLAWSTVLYFNLSFGWQLLYLRGKTGRAGIAPALAKTAGAALAAAAAVWLVISRIHGHWLQGLVGAALAVGVYVGVLLLVKSDVHEFWGRYRRGSAAPVI